MLVVDKTKCTGCGVCNSICPVEAITVGDDEKANIDPDICMECYSCKDSCASEAISEID